MNERPLMEIELRLKRSFALMQGLFGFLSIGLSFRVFAGNGSLRMFLYGGLSIILSLFLLRLLLFKKKIYLFKDRMVCPTGFFYSQTRTVPYSQIGKVVSDGVDSTTSTVRIKIREGRDIFYNFRYFENDISATLGEFLKDKIKECEDSHFEAEAVEYVKSCDEDSNEIIKDDEIKNDQIENDEIKDNKQVQSESKTFEDVKYYKGEELEYLLICNESVGLITGFIFVTYLFCSFSFCMLSEKLAIQVFVLILCFISLIFALYLKDFRSYEKVIFTKENIYFDYGRYSLRRNKVFKRSDLQKIESLSDFQVTFYFKDFHTVQLVLLKRLRNSFLYIDLYKVYNYTKDPLPFLVRESAYEDLNIKFDFLDLFHGKHL